MLEKDKRDTEMPPLLFPLSSQRSTLRQLHTLLHYTHTLRYKSPICFCLSTNSKLTFWNEQFPLIRLLKHTGSSLTCPAVRSSMCLSIQPSSIWPSLTLNEECSTKSPGKRLLKSPNKLVKHLLTWRAGESAAFVWI